MYKHAMVINRKLLLKNMQRNREHSEVLLDFVLEECSSVLQISSYISEDLEQ